MITYPCSNFNSGLNLCPNLSESLSVKINFNYDSWNCHNKCILDCNGIMVPFKVSPKFRNRDLQLTYQWPSIVPVLITMWNAIFCAKLFNHLWNEIMWNNNDCFRVFFFFCKSSNPPWTEQLHILTSFFFLKKGGTKIILTILSRSQ